MVLWLKKKRDKTGGLPGICTYFIGAQRAGPEAQSAGLRSHCIYLEGMGREEAVKGGGEGRKQQIYKSSRLTQPR